MMTAEEARKTATDIESGVNVAVLAEIELDVRRAVSAGLLSIRWEKSLPDPVEAHLRKLKYGINYHACNDWDRFSSAYYTISW